MKLIYQHICSTFRLFVVFFSSFLPPYCFLFNFSCQNINYSKYFERKKVRKQQQKKLTQLPSKWIVAPTHTVIPINSPVIVIYYISFVVIPRFTLFFGCGFDRCFRPKRRQLKKLECSIYTFLWIVQRFLLIPEYVNSLHSEHRIAQCYAKRFCVC